MLYVSYNTLPGWASLVPLRHLLTEHAEVMAAPGRGIVSRIDAALEFAEKLFALDPRYIQSNLQVGERFNFIKTQNRHYLAHEYFNRDWHPMHFAAMAEWLEPAKLTYACSANYLDHVDDLNFTAKQKDFLNEIPDLQFRESVRDFMVNQQFRKDYWVKGPRRMDSLELIEAVRQQKIILTTPRSDVSLKIKANLGEAELAGAVYNPILDRVADHEPHTIGEIEQALKDQGLPFAALAQAITVLVGSGHVAAVQDEAIITKARKQTEKLNAYLIDKARSSSELSYLTSPVTGGGVGVGRFEQLFLMAAGQGERHPDDWASFVWQTLSTQGQKIVKEGKTIESPEDNLSELRAQAKIFAEKRLPILKALQIA